MRNARLKVFLKGRISPIPNCILDDFLLLINFPFPGLIQMFILHVISSSKCLWPAMQQISYKPAGAFSGIFSCRNLCKQEVGCFVNTSVFLVWMDKQ